MKIIFLSFILILIISCASNRAIDNETILFSVKSEPKLWIINVISTDTVCCARHVCILISYTPIYGKKYVSFYTSFWSENDQNFSSGFHSEEIPVQKNKLSFPIEIETILNDSIHDVSRLKFGRNTMKYQTTLYNDLTNNYFNFKMKGVFEKMLPYSISNGPMMGSILPINAKIKLSGNYKDQFRSDISMHVIHNPQEVMDKTKNNFIGFLDMRLTNENNCSILFETDGADYTAILNQSFWKNGINILQNNLSKIVPTKAENWQSSHSGKSYPLGYLITLPFDDKQILIKPTIDDQEIKSNQNSFWMGAVKLFDEEGGSIIGAGNLYILKQ